MLWSLMLHLHPATAMQTVKNNNPRLESMTMICPGLLLETLEDLETVVDLDLETLAVCACLCSPVP